MSTGDDGGLASDPQFSVTDGGEAGTLAPGDNREVSVTFSRPAGDINRYIGVLVIESNAETSPDRVNMFANPPQQYARFVS